MIKNHHLAVIIPAYKAENSVLTVIKGIPDFIDSIIVVDDCSPDDTAKVVLAAVGDRVHLIRLEKNLGVGGATIAGMKAAIDVGADILIKMDSDNQMDPKYLPALISPLIEKEADYVKGNRFVFLRDLSSMPGIRIFGNFFLSLLSKLSSGYWQVFDPTNGYLAIHANSFTLLNISKLDSRFFFETSLLNEAGLNRFVVKEVGIRARYRDETSNLSEVHSLISFPRKLVKAMVKRFWVQYVIRDFGIITLYAVFGLFSLFFGSTFGLYHWIKSINAQVATPTGTVMIAVLPIIIGVQLLIQALALDSQNTPIKPRCAGTLTDLEHDLWD